MREKIYPHGKIINADVLEGLKGLEDESVDCVITSPPYWQLRDYGYPEQWGLEPTFQEYLEHLWQMMDEVYRVLKPGGTVWINLGDTYGSFRGKSGQGADSFERAAGINKKESPKNSLDRPSNMRAKFDKCLLLIPHRFAIGAIERGWILRNDIIWAKPNGMPESVTDRFSKKHEFIFFFTKQQKYFFDLDAVREPHKEDSIKRAARAHKGLKTHGAVYGANWDQENVGYQNLDERLANGELRMVNTNGKNPGDVSDFWAITTKPSSAKHYATFNNELISKPILAGCPEGGIVLDPFAGTGTTLLYAHDLGRKFIGVEASEKYFNDTVERMDQHFGLFMDAK